MNVLGITEDILREYGVRIKKVKLNPLDHGDFVQICDQLNDGLVKAVKNHETLALDGVVKDLDVDWANLTDERKKQVIESAKSRIRWLPPVVIAALLLALGRTLDIVVVETRKRAIETFGLRTPEDATTSPGDPIPDALSLDDLRVSESLLSAQGLFIEEEYKRRAAILDKKVTDEVTTGLAAGMTGASISSVLAETIKESQKARSELYLGVMSTAFPGYLRSAVLLNAFAEAGIKRYRFVSDLCENVSEICYFMHDRTFSVDAAQKQMLDAERLTGVSELRDLRPWVSRGVDGEGKKVLYFNRGGQRVIVAEVSDEGFENAMETSELEASGIMIPPLHGCCHSTIVPV